MTATTLKVLIYGIPFLLFWICYFLYSRYKTKRNTAIKNESIEAGLTEPASLHPVIDHSLCIGCGSCVKACPEAGYDVLGLINRKAELINPTACIGHAACKTACPADAISLVFGTEKRGVDIPHVKPNFESNMPGIFIAGELGGMGLIRNAIEQGRQAMEGISELEGLGSNDQLDVVIVGAGPAGIAASLGAMEKKLRFVTIDQDSFGGTVANFPRGKLVMTAPATLPLIGKMHFKETTKEALMEYWEDVKQKTGLTINNGEQVEDVEKTDQGYVVKTSKNTYRTRAVLLAIGRRGLPRKLGVPGEGLTKVVYKLIDPEQYARQHVLVVGGGDSALEAATSIAAEPGTTVTLSYRSSAFGRAKAKNRDRVAEAEASGRLRVLMNSNVKEISENQVVIDQEGELHELDNNSVIVCAGGILPTPFLKQIGIKVETKYGTA